MKLLHIGKRFDEKTVLDDFSLDLHTGITCLMGASGAGKTTLLRILLGLETPDSGTVQDMPARAAVVFQEDRLEETMTVRANLHLSLGKRYDEARAQGLLGKLLLPDVLTQRVSALSGGMKRRVALCRALMFDAPLVVLDEPFKGLDDATKKAAMEAVRTHCAGRTALIVTHDEDEAAYLGARVVRM